VSEFRTEGFDLFAWQAAAVDAWTVGANGRPYFGTLEVVTGGGKTLIALSCVERAAAAEPDLRVAVVVPTQALARQWREAVIRYTSVRAEDVGLLGAGGKGSLQSHRILIAVLNTAAKKLPEMAAGAQPLMLIVDECHRAGAPSFSKVLDTGARFRLGLSATPDREELNEAGEPLAYDEQKVGESLGEVVYSFGLKEAREAGWLPEYTLHHHAVALTPDERARYEAISRQVDDAADDLRGLGGETTRSRQLSSRKDELGDAARRWVSLTGQRKDLLYRAAERHRVAQRIVTKLFDKVDGETPRAILFHERVNEAVQLYEYLIQTVPVPVALEHSRLSENQRAAALTAFATGRAPVLVSVKSLIEGIDVPAANAGVSVASTASVRQRIQALGRVLRRAVDGGEKRAEMHLLYVDDSVDDLIYGKTDWTDLTGRDANVYWRWPEGAEAPERLAHPPRTPLPTERDAWALVGEDIPREWPGAVTGQEYSVSTTGVVHNAFKALIANPQGVGEMVTALRGKPGGRFHVTPELHLVLVWHGASSPGGVRPWVVGRLEEPFRVAHEIEDASSLDDSELVPGHPYHGPTDRTGGTYRISQRADGTIEQTVKGGREMADSSGPGVGAANARAVLTAWNDLDRSVSRFFVNKLGHAWYEADGERRFLARVAGGFDWPTSEKGS
jgi:superfamily II DNA or RNA helicase